MRRILSLSCATAFACGGAVANGPVANSPTSPGSIRDIDFANYTYSVSLFEGEPRDIAVADGAYSGEPATGVSISFGVEAPVYGDLTGDGAEEAVIVTSLRSDGSGAFDEARVYAMQDGTPTQIGTIPGGDRADGGISGVRVDAGEVVVERFQSESGACCPEQVRTEHWRWEEAAFVEDEARRSLRAIEAE